VVHTTGADIASVGAYSTYTRTVAEDAPDGYARTAPPPDVVDEVRQDIDALLQQKGYKPAPDGALIVRVSTGTRIVMKEPTGTTAAAGAPATEQTEGALVIDIFERATGRQVFHGFARARIAGGRVDRDQIANAVSQILEPVPPSAP
jgi:hypothetical protein